MQRTPREALDSAIEVVSRFTPAFDTSYATWNPPANEAADDTLTIAPSPALAHHGQRRSAHAPHGREVHLDDPLEGLRVGGVGRTVASPADADDVDEHVDMAAVRQRTGDDGGALLVVGHVGRERRGTAAAVPDRRCRFLGAVGNAIDAEHLGTLPGERRGDCPTVADRVARRLTGTDDHRRPSGEASSAHRPIVVNGSHRRSPGASPRPGIRRSPNQ